MKILAVEFSSAQRSVALLSCSPPPQDGPIPAGDAAAGQKSVQDQVVEVIETGHGAMRGAAMIAQVLRKAGAEPEQVDRLAIGIGPGSYTGIRSAIALAQGWQLALGTRLQAVPSANCLAVEARAHGLQGRVHVVIDAQRGEFYLAAYDIGPGILREAGALRLASRVEVTELERAGEILAGPEITRWFPSGRLLFPAAAAAAALAARQNEFVAGENLDPIYLRESNFVKAPSPRTFSPAPDRGIARNDKQNPGAGGSAPSP